MAKAITEYLKQNGLTPKGDATDGAGGGKAGEEGGGAGSGGEGGDGKEKPKETPAPDKGKDGGEGGIKPGDVPITEKNKEGDTAPPADDDIPEEKLLAALAKKGHKFSSLADLKPTEQQKPLTQEEQEAAALERQDNIRQYALRSKKVTSTQFDNYIKETSIPPVELAFSIYKEERLKELKDAKTAPEQIPDDKELRAEFDEAHFQYADENDPKKKRHDKILQKQVDSYIEEKYANILDLDEEFSAHEQTTIKRRDYEQTIEKVIAQVPDEMEFEIQGLNDKDKFPFKFKITPDVKKALRLAYTNETSFSLFGQGNVKPELITEAIKGNIIQREFAKILSEGAVAYASQKLDAAAKGRRGIPPERKESGSEGGEKKVNKTIQGLLNQPENKQVLQTK